MAHDDDEAAKLARIERRLAMLPRMQRAVFLLCRLDGLSYYNGSGTLLRRYAHGNHAGGDQPALEQILDLRPDTQSHTHQNGKRGTQCKTLKAQA